MSKHPASLAALAKVHAKTEPESLDAVAAELAAQVETPFVALYTSHPVQNLRLGAYHFVKGRLEFKSEAEHDKFCELIETLPPQTRGLFRKVSLEQAQKLALAAVGGPMASQGIATSESMRAAAKIAEEQRAAAAAAQAALMNSQTQ